MIFVIWWQYITSTSYMVLFKKPNESQIDAKSAYLNNIMRTTSYFSPTSHIETRLMNGYIAKLDDETVNKLKKDNEIAVIEKDQLISIADYKVKQVFESLNFYKTEKDKKELDQRQIKIRIQENAPWGLSRVVGKPYIESHKYIYPDNLHNDVFVYILDTGINVIHPDFKGRARWGKNLVFGSADNDENGHGTHVAGIVGGARYGINKKCNLVAVKVMDANGTGMISNLMKGIDFVIEEHEKRKDVLYDVASSKVLAKGKSRNLNHALKTFIKSSELNPKTIINMSVGGGKSQALNFAIAYATSLGIHFSVAAGNDNLNACHFSPGSSSHAITIGASDINDKTAKFTNYGGCVDIFAPGVDILSSWNDIGSRLASGTSMAAPHVAGTMSLYLALRSYTPKELKEAILKDSINVITYYTEYNPHIKRFLSFGLYEQAKMPLVSTNKLMGELIKKYKSISKQKINIH